MGSPFVIRDSGAASFRLSERMSGITPFDPLASLQTGFSSGSSVWLIIILLIVCVVGIVLTHLSGDPWSCCLVSVDGKVNDNPWWAIYLDSYRGKDYYVLKQRTDTDEKSAQLKDTAQRCVVTAWSMAHFLFYALLAFVAPKLFWPIFLISVVWELLEYLVSDCHDVLDIFWNFAGLLVGVYLRQRFFPVDLPSSVPDPRLFGASTPTSVGVAGRTNA